MSDRASKALAEAPLPGEPRTYDATSKRSGVPLTTLYCIIVIMGGSQALQGLRQAPISKRRLFLAEPL